MAATATLSAPRATTWQALAGTGALVRLALRRDRWRLSLWILGIALVQISGLAAYPNLYPTAADRQAQATIMETSPAIRALTGPGHGLDNYTFGAMMTNEYLGFMVVFAALMSVLLVVRHTRAEEEDGRAELVRAGVVGRHAQLAAALSAALIANLVLGALIAAGMAAQGVESVDWPGSLLFGAAYAGVGMVFAAVAAVTAQVVEFSRAAAGAAGALIGIAYVIRAIGDVAENGVSWLSPIGWAQATAAYVDNSWAPIGLLVVATLLLSGVAVHLSDRRDVGAGLRAPGAGAGEGSDLLVTPEGFAWRLQRSSVAWWALAMLIAGLSYGSEVNIIEDYANNDVVQKVVSDIRGVDLTEAWLSMIIALLAIISSVFATISALRPRREEGSGRAEAVLSTPLTRTRWMLTHVAIAFGGSVVVLLAYGVGLGGGAALLTGDGGYLTSVLAAALSYVPAVWLVAAVGVFAHGLLPRMTWLPWLVVVFAALCVYLGGILQFPQWLLDISPFTHVARMPAESFSVGPLLVLLVITAGLLAAGLAGFARRDVDTP